MLGDRDEEMEGLLAAARERELRLILDEERAERRLARARNRLEAAHRRLERAERRVERRRRRLAEAEAELQSCQTRRASGLRQSSSFTQEADPDSDANIVVMPPVDGESDSVE